MNVTVELVGIIASVASVAVWLTWFLAAQFSKTRRLFYHVISLHNREDDDRFEALSNDIWQLHLRNAARDGSRAPERKTFPRRRYLEMDQQSAGQPAPHGYDI